MTSVEHPFVDNGEGFPTPDSARQALDMFKMTPLADAPISYMGREGSMVDLITECKIEQLITDWPNGFAGTVMTAAKQAARNTGRG